MTKDELLRYVSDNNVDLKKYDIIIGERSATPYAVGCYEEAGVWTFYYAVGEDKRSFIVKEGTEEEVCEYMFLKIGEKIR